MKSRMNLRFLALCLVGVVARAENSPAANADTSKAEHVGINVATETATSHTQNPGAQWYPEAGLGLFVHWDPCVVKGLNIGWSMINSLDGHPAQITPNGYFALAKEFQPQNYHPEKWLKVAKDAGFAYAVLTTRHHSGFALWPSKYGDFDTDNYLGGRDLVREFVEACRKNGLKVGFYYSPPNWYFEREFKNFEFDKNKPPLDADLKVRTTKPTEEQLKKLDVAYAEMIRGQIKELLTQYGKIDVLWFDGRPPRLGGDAIVTLDEIRQWQPSVVINPRFHGKGDFITYERKLRTNSVAKQWAEYCNTWTAYWGYVTGARFRAPAFIIGQYALCRSLHINYLPSLGPRADGELEPAAYENLAVFGRWVAQNGESVHGTQPLPMAEKASVPATSSGHTRYLFAIPKFANPDNPIPQYPMPEDQLPPEDTTLTLSGLNAAPKSVSLLASHDPLKFTYDGGTLRVALPASCRTPLVDVVRVELAE
jgi:alpha-L-fucosidase